MVAICLQLSLIVSAARAEMLAWPRFQGAEAAMWLEVWGVSRLN